MDTSTDIGTLIVRSPGLCGGQPRIAGTGVSVKRVVGWYKLGLSPEEIAEQFGHLTLAHVYAALTYYHANQQEIEAALRDEDAEAEALFVAFQELCKKGETEDVFGHIGKT